MAAEEAEAEGGEKRASFVPEVFARQQSRRHHQQSHERCDDANRHHHEHHHRQHFCLHGLGNPVQTVPRSYSQCQHLLRGMLRWAAARLAAVVK